MRRLLPALACALLCACVHYRTESTQAPTALGASASVPEGFATGETTAYWVFGLGPFGSDDPKVAVQKARGKMLETTMSDITVERRVTCVPVCGWALYRSVDVVATGSLLAPRGYRDPEKAAAEKIISQRYPEPSGATLVERLRSFYLSDPAEAESYYESLPEEKRSALASQVLSQSGLTPLYGDVYRAPATATPEDCRFLAWFLQQHSDYRLSAESCKAP